jgi:phosphohistidine swiveling domain-containing protein
MTRTAAARMNILWLGAAGGADPAQVGGKSAQLSRLAARYRVPAGFTLTTAAYAAWAGAASEADADAEALPLPPQVAEDLRAAYAELARRSGVAAPAVAVRSSAADEDGGEASFAGQHETYLNVVSPDALVDAVRRCWASARTPRALEYRRAQGLALAGAQVAVLVQQMVVADVAAVAFSADPLTGDRDVVVINASWGLGESIVGGDVTPDTYRVPAADPARVEPRIATKRVMTVAVAGGTRQMPTPQYLRDQPALTGEQAQEIARLALALQAFFGRPVDLECAYEAGRLYLLQCRPITTLGRAPAAERPAAAPPAPPSGAGAATQPIAAPTDFPVHWERAADAELFWTLDQVHWGEPMAPLVFSVAGHALALGLTLASAAYDRPIAGVRARLINSYRYQASIPLPVAPDEAAEQGRRSRDKLRAAMSRLAETWATAWLPEVQAHLDYWAAFDLRGASLPALMEHIEETDARAARVWEIHFLLASPMYAAMSQFGKLYRDLFGSESALDAYRLLEGFDDKTVESGQALWALSRRALADPELRRLVLELPTPAVLPALDARESTRPFAAALRAYLDEFGQRGESISPESPSWIEDPTPVIAGLRGYMAQPDRDLQAERARLAAERTRLVAEARQRLTGYPGPVVQEFEFLLKAAQEARVLSEDHNFWIDFRSMYRVRHAFLEVGRRLAADGALAAAEDVFYLTLEEVRENGARPALDRGALVAERRAARERFRRIAPPPMLGAAPAEQQQHDPLGRALNHFYHAEGHASGASDLLSGVAGATGVARGPARVVRSLAEAGALRPGEILVAPTMAPSWTPLFATAAAVVTDTGGALSHAAVVAREYGLPAVVGAGAATALIENGQMIEVDGGAGVVRLLSA